jgi:CheY-like chemotaxis protein
LARIPAVVLSGSGLESDIEEAYRLGANTYFTKPGQLAELRKVIGALIDYWRRSQRPSISAPSDG